MINLGPIFLSTPTPAIWPISLVLLAFVVFLIARRHNHKRLAIRLAAGILAVLSLGALAVQPLWLVSHNPSDTVLLTPGAEVQQPHAVLDSLLQTTRSFSLPGLDTAFFRGQKSKTIPDLGYLQRHDAVMGKLHVFGHGLREYDWAEMDSFEISTHLAPADLGIASISWPRESYLGEKLRVQGSLAGLLNKKYILQLVDPGGDAASFEISPPPGGAFAFQLLPRAAGKFLYQLLLKSERGDTLTRETLDIVVREPQPLKILILEATIRFDTKYLKIWASRHHYGLARRALLSRDRYREEFINLSPTPLRQITPNLLRDFDLIIVDGNTLAVLPPTARRSLRSAIESEGLGMLIIPDETIFGKQIFPERDFFAAFDFEKFAGMDQRLLKPIWPDLDTLRVHAVPAEPFALKNLWGMKPLILDEMTRPLAAAVVRGNGKIGLSLIRDSYRWVLAGKSDLHASYWSYLLSELSRPHDRQDQWNVRHAGPIFIDQPLALFVNTQQSDPVGLMETNAGQADSVFLAQDFTAPSRWHGTYWPRVTGWHAIATPTGAASWFYVHDRGQWLSWQQAQKTTATLQQAARNGSLSRQNLTSTFLQVETISPIWFFLAFLLGAGYLWLERKL